MQGDEAYVLSKALTAAVAAGVQNYTISETGLLEFDTSDGQHLSYQFQEPEDGVSVTEVDVDNDDHLIITFSDGTTQDAGIVPTVKGDKGDQGVQGPLGPQGPEGPAGPKGDKGDVGTTNYPDLLNKPEIEGVTLTGNTSFADLGLLAINGLLNYYNKTNTYSKTEVDQMVSAISGMHLEIVEELPSSDISLNTIYLVPNQTSIQDNIYNEYIYIQDESSWELIGSTAADLSGYVTDNDLSIALSDYTTTDVLDLLLASKQDTSDKMGVGDMDDVMTPLPGVSGKFHKYSTSEQIVGEWIDGKKIYEKVFTHTSTKGQQINTNITALNIDTVVDLAGSVKANDFTIPINTYRSDINTLVLTGSGDTNLITVADGGLVSGTLYWKVILQYTKKTT